MKLFLPRLLAALILLAGAGCESVRYYQNRAVNRAREYLLDNAEELTPEQAYFVKFNKPVLLSAPIIGSPGASEQRQICITWRIPGTETDYMVYGTSAGTMEFWYPVRLIRRPVNAPPAQPLDKAIVTARTYATDALWERLTPAQFNQVRFDFPYLAVTDFELNFNPGGNLTEAEVEQARARAARSVQFSLVWKVTGADWLVFCGTGAITLAGWQVNFAGLMPAAEVEQHIVKLIRTPEDGDTPFDCAAAVDAINAPPSAKPAKEK